MKKYITLTLILLGVLSLTATALLPTSDPGMPDPPADAVGAPNNSGPPTVYVDKLVKSFVEGGTINSFDIAYLGGEWNLIRRGTLGSDKRTEMIPVTFSGGYYRFYIPVWYYICNRNSSDCGSSPCQPNTARTSCNCNNTACNFGMSVDQIVQTQVLY